MGRDPSIRRRKKKLDKLKKEEKFVVSRVFCRFCFVFEAIGQLKKKKFLCKFWKCLRQIIYRVVIVVVQSYEKSKLAQK